jgi:hypothetical protein
MRALPRHGGDGENQLMFDRRNFLAALATMAITGRLDAAPVMPPRRMIVYKTRTCGCCTKWVDHARAAGFAITVHDTDDIATVKRTLGVPQALESCHTGVVGDYVIEGHVPADLVQRLLDTRPAGVRGLAVPGMPEGSPGMETGRKDAYDVVSFDRAGRTRVYARR